MHSLCKQNPALQSIVALQLPVTLYCSNTSGILHVLLMQNPSEQSLENWHCSPKFEKEKRNGVNNKRKTKEINIFETIILTLITPLNTIIVEIKSIFESFQEILNKQM